MDRPVTLRLCTEDAVVLRIAEVLRRQIAERTGVAVVPSPEEEALLALEIDSRLGPEGLRIADESGGGIKVSGGDARGLLYGVGKLLRNARYSEGQFAPGTWRGVSKPQKPVRGIYFATHFHDYYHEAPVDEVQRYLAELALWGTNVVIVWFDMHHFEGIDDPAAREMIERLRAILRAASELGIGAGLGFLANEAYANSPEALRADWTAGHDGYYREPRGHYHVELCPNKPGARELLLHWVDERLEAFADLDLTYLWIWPYDQGGCTCARCKPWGCNGFLTIAEPIARRFRRRYPSGQVVLSTWYFDHFTRGEWEGLARAFAERPDWVDFLLADDYGDQFPSYPLTHGVPGGLPMVGFPEISMYEAGPWGGFGANPLPQHLQALWDSAGAYLAGGFPYSEGIYEDLNKAICAQFYWEDRPAIETVREYIAYEYAPEVVASVSRAISILERNLPRARRDEGADVRFVMQQTEGAEEALALLQAADSKLSSRARTAWRWRVLYLRARIDYELARNGFAISARCEEAFQELVQIYHAQRAAYWVSPPTREAIQAYRQT